MDPGIREGAAERLTFRGLAVWLDMWRVQVTMKEVRSTRAVLTGLKHVYGQQYRADCVEGVVQ